MSQRGLRKQVSCAELDFESGNKLANKEVSKIRPLELCFNKNRQVSKPRGGETFALYLGSKVCKMQERNDCSDFDEPRA